jgi:predicted enzyme related to lactoylglutathione lyase
MSAENERRIDYIEFPATDVALVRKFYETVFGWKFNDYGPEYTDFNDGRINGGFYRHASKPSSPLVVIYAKHLKKIKADIIAAGGKISRDTFSFPGGCRFHFTDPADNELGVWSETEQ